MLREHVSVGAITCSHTFLLDVSKVFYHVKSGPQKTVFHHKKYLLRVCVSLPLIILVLGPIIILSQTC